VDLIKYQGKINEFTNSSFTVFSDNFINNSSLNNTSPSNVSPEKINNAPPTFELTEKEFEKKWYLECDNKNDLLFNWEGKIKGGTFEALVER